MISKYVYIAVDIEDGFTIRKFYHRRDAVWWIHDKPEFRFIRIKQEVPNVIDWNNYEPALF